MSLISESRWRPEVRMTRMYSACLSFSSPNMRSSQHLREADDRVERRAELVGHVGEELGLVAAGRLQLAVQAPQLVVHAVQVGGERPQLVAVRDVDAPGEVPRRDLREARVHLLAPAPTSDHEMANPSTRARPMAPDRKPDDRPPRPHERLVARVHAGHHVGLGLVDELVREPLQPVGQRGGLRELQLSPFRGPAAPDQLHDPRDDPDELVVVGSHAAEQLDLVRATNCRRSRS